MKKPFVAPVLKAQASLASLTLTTQSCCVVPSNDVT